MKPLLAAPLTTEDDWSWYMVMCRKNGRSFGIRSFSLQSDSRDAELMLASQDCPQRSVYLANRHGHNVTWAEAIDVRQGSDRL